MNKSWVIICLFSLISCYQTLTIDGFNQDNWSKQLTCAQNRLSEAKVLIDNEELLLASNQNEIQHLLGNPDEHELYSRNQKFFYYNLSAKCDGQAQKRLALRFDALGRVSEVNIIQVISN